MNDKVKPAAPGTAIVSWKEKMAAVTAQAAASEAPKGGFLSFKGGIMSYDETPIPNNKMDVIVIDFLLENAIFAEKYNPMKKASPTCYAFGRDEATLAPHPDAPNPQAESCAVCPKNEWASDPDGGRGKACKNSRRIAIMPADALRDGVEGVKKSNVIMCKIPITSVVHFSRYVNQCTKVLGKPPFAVVCELATKPSPKNLFEVQWSIREDVKSEELVQALYEKHVSLERQMFQPYPVNDEEAKPASKKY